MLFGDEIHTTKCLIVSALMVETSKSLLYLYYDVYGPDVTFK